MQGTGYRVQLRVSLTIRFSLSCSFSPVHDARSTMVLVMRMHIHARAVSCRRSVVVVGRAVTFVVY